MAQVAQVEDEEFVEEYKPDFSLKNKIGKDVSIGEILTTTNIKDAQGVINDSQKDFVKWIENDLRTLEGYFAEAYADADNALDAVVGIQKYAFSIKSQSGTFGYDLASAIAKSLYDFCENNYVVGDNKHILIIRKHLDTLNVIFKRKITGDGGNVGQQVYQALGKLITKFDHPDA
ncbi:MAG: hypothetical protein FJX23_09300 [Alphaproteobacteria bacterium]|nr:hypothetical protein [Alphaproteobacteria bacterium]